LPCDEERLLWVFSSNQAISSDSLKISLEASITFFVIIQQKALNYKKNPNEKGFY